MTTVHRLSWLDGMPVVFNYPVEESPRAEDFEVSSGLYCVYLYK